MEQKLCRKKSFLLKSQQLHLQAVNILLSWDLFIIVFFGVVITYSLLIGRNSTLKVIIATYMAILTADGLGNIFEQYLLPASPALAGDTGIQALILLKIAVFVIVILLLVVKGGFHMDILAERSMVFRLLSNLSFGFLNAGLIVSTLLVYLTGGSFVSGTLHSALETNLYQESQLVQMMVDNYSVWFAIPAIAVVVISFLAPHAD